MRSRTGRPSASEISVTFNRFGRKRRLVLMFEWLTLWPTWADLPVNSHRRDMACLKKANAPASPARSIETVLTQLIGTRAMGVKFAIAWGLAARMPERPIWRPLGGLIGVVPLDPASWKRLPLRWTSLHPCAAPRASGLSPPPDPAHRRRGGLESLHWRFV